ncbi:MAG TPA: hypothetical protein VGC22_01055 [Chitinophaga sp.]
MRKRKGTVIVPYYDHKYISDWKTQRLISKSDQAPYLTESLLHLRAGAIANIRNRWGH